MSASSAHGRPFTLVLASANMHKIREFRAMLKILPKLDVLSLCDFPSYAPPPETGASFEENANLKALHAAKALGKWVLADDSGLAVDALGGAPGVRSKRWAAAPGVSGPALDAANNARLLRELAGVVDRGARFVCAAAWVDGEGEMVARGEVRGRILEERRGEAGFGYDPYFWSDELGRGFGESSREEKATVSHRARAVRALLASLSARDGLRGPRG